MGINTVIKNSNNTIVVDDNNDSNSGSKSSNNTRKLSKINQQITPINKLEVRHWRSLLFIPQYAYGKASQIGADCYIADLQDSIPLHLKAEARQGIIDADLKGTFKNHNLIVRINELEEYSELCLDLDKMVGLSSVLGFLVTMIESADDMNKLHAMVSAEEQKKGIPVGTYRFMVLIETPAAIFNALEIARAGGGRNIGMLLGSGDLFRLTKAESTIKLTLDFPRNDVVLACRAAGIEPFDTPYTNISDKLGLEWSCISGKKHGFTGKAAIHSDHIKMIKRIFTPDLKKIKQAKAILAAQKLGELTVLQQKTKWSGTAKEARVTDGMGKLNGKLIGPPHIKDSIFILEQVKALVPEAKPGLRGKTVSHVISNELKLGEVIPNPFEITITEPLLGLWQASFYSQDRVVTSQLYAQKLGLVPKGQSPVPFMMGLYLAVCMSETHGALYHLGFRNARQYAPIYTGLTVCQNIIVKSIKLTSNKKNSIVTTRRELINVATNQVLFSVDKLELHAALNFSVIENRTATSGLYDASAAAFKLGLLTQCATEKKYTAPRGKILQLESGQLILHSFTRPLGIDTNLALSTWFKVTHPIHLDHHIYEDSDTKGVIVSGGLVEALTIAASSRDFHEVVWEELIQGDNLAPVGPRDTIGAISYIMDKKVFDTPIRYEELTIRTFGLKNISPAVDCADLDFPFELFDADHKKPSEYDAILEQAGAYWLEGKLATVVTRKIVRLVG